MGDSLLPGLWHNDAKESPFIIVCSLAHFSEPQMCYAIYLELFIAIIYELIKVTYIYSIGVHS